VLESDSRDGSVGTCRTEQIAASNSRNRRFVVGRIIHYVLVLSVVFYVRRNSMKDPSQCLSLLLAKDSSPLLKSEQDVEWELIACTVAFTAITAQ
jgi:hypothetical protein